LPIRNFFLDLTFADPQDRPENNKRGNRMPGFEFIDTPTTRAVMTTGRA